MPSFIVQTPRPFVTLAAFKAHPTFLELDNLRSGSSSATDQDAVLLNILLEASRWAENEAEMSLHARTVTETGRLFPDRRGRLKLHCTQTPVRSVSQIAWGITYGQMTTYNSPTVFMEGNETVIYEIGGGSWSWGPGPLQLGLGVAPIGVEVYTSITYAAGYANALLTAGANSGTATLTVDDPTGIMPGDLLRLWDPGLEEVVKVAPGYVPGSTAVTLAANLTKTHASGVGLSALPPDGHLAVIMMACALLMHPDRQAEDEFPDGSTSSTRASDARQDGSGLVAEARRLIGLFKVGR
jgi:hypothetical protein